MAKHFLHELFTSRLLNIRYDVVAGYRQAIEHNVLNHLAVQFPEKINGYVLTRSSAFSEQVVASSNPERAMAYGNLRPDDQFINVLNVTGPVTRSGGGCSYGSMEHRDQILWACEQPNCIGHLFVIDTPGGMSWSKYDYQQAIDAAHAAGQPVIAFVDGQCCSAGMCLAAMCDERYFMNDADEIGCIGTMAAFYTNKDGDINSIDQSRFVEIYAEGSPDKNVEFRNAAQGDYELLQKEINEDAEIFKAIVRKGCPNVTDEHLTGKVFKAVDVKGILVDDKATMNECLERIIALNEEKNPSTPASPASVDDPEAGDTSPSASTTVPSPSCEESASSSPIFPNSNNMKSYNQIQKACDVEALVCDKNNGIYLVESMCDSLEQTLANAEQKELTLDAKIAEVASLNASIKSMKEENEQTLANVETLHNEKIDSLNSEHATAIEALNSEHAEAIEALNGIIAERDNTIAELNSTVAAKDEEISNLKAQIEELSKNPTATPMPQGGAPANNGATAKSPKMAQNILNAEMTPAEKRQALAERMRMLQR